MLACPVLGEHYLLVAMQALQSVHLRNVCQRTDDNVEYDLPIACPDACADFTLLL